jgi:hypothetical protein
MDIMKEFIETVRMALKAEIQAFSMVASLRGVARTHAIYRAIDVLQEQNGSVPTDPTAEGRNVDDEKRTEEATDCKAHYGLAQACSVLAILDAEFGLWENDEGIEGAIRYQMECNTPKVSEDEEAELFGSDHDALRQREEMQATFDRLDRFKSDVAELVMETQQAAMCELDNAPTPDWLADSVGKAANKQIQRMRQQYRKGIIAKGKIVPIVEHLKAMAWVANHS